MRPLLGDEPRVRTSIPNQGHPTSCVPSVTRTGAHRWGSNGENPLLTLHVDCPAKARYGSGAVAPATSVEPFGSDGFGAAAASGFSPSTATGSRHCLTGCVNPGDMQCCPRLRRGQSDTPGTGIPLFVADFSKRFFLCISMDFGAFSMHFH